MSRREERIVGAGSGGGLIDEFGNNREVIRWRAVGRID